MGLDDFKQFEETEMQDAGLELDQDFLDSQKNELASLGGEVRESIEKDDIESIDKLTRRASYADADLNILPGAYNAFTSGDPLEGSRREIREILG